MDALSPLGVGAAGSLIGSLVLFFAMLIGHAVADFGLQSDFIARNKVRSAAHDGPPGLWFHVLFAHSLIHAGAVWVITGSPALAAAELALHALIDHVRGRETLSFNADQSLHILCKAAYTIFLYFAIL